MKFTETHEWVEKREKVVRIGITEAAVREIGEVVYIHLPKVGKRLEADEEVLVIESTKAAIDSYAPLTGVVTKVNKELNANLSLINKDPEGEGWMYEMEMEIPSEYDNLLLSTDPDANLAQS